MKFEQVDEKQLNEYLQKAAPEREISDEEHAAMDICRKLGADGIRKAPVSIESIFNYINSVRFGGEGIFARIEAASETSKYETGSKILALYSSENEIYNVAEQIHGCRLAEIQLDNADYLCTDMKVPYRPQPAYYSCMFSKHSLMTWEHIGDLEKWNTDMFVSYLLASLRNAMIETIYQAFDALSLSYSTIETPITSGIAKKQLKQITDALERHVKRG